MSTTELSVPSPRGLSRLRRNKNPANGSSNSLASSLSVSKDSDAGGDGGIRSSIDRVIDRAARRGSADDGDGGGGDGSSSSRRLSAMFSRVKKRRERGLARSESEQSADSPEGGPAPSGIPGNQSDVSLLDASGNSSLLTEDYSDNEGYVFFQFFVSRLVLSFDPPLGMLVGLQCRRRRKPWAATAALRPAMHVTVRLWDLARQRGASREARPASCSAIDVSAASAHPRIWACLDCDVVLSFLPSTYNLDTDALILSACTSARPGPFRADYL